MNKTVDIAIFKRKWLDVAYASKSETQKMDIFLPNEGKGPFPVIILIHGGFYKTGDKKDERDYMIEILNRGYAAASINYRLIDEATFPAQIYDVKAAIRYVRANASKYNINSNKIATWGTSAGGHLSALAGTSGDVPELDNLELGNANQSTKIQAAVDWFGPINFLTMDDQFRESGVDGQVHNVATSSESLLIGKQINLAKDLVQKANPETYITADDPPIYIQHGTNDIIVPIQQSMEFSNNLVKYIGSNKLVYESLKGASHGDPAFRRKENVDRILDFIDKYLK
ncbi:MAG: alpha/beta hydrolase [Clostridiales bacterium GWD2_32_19]|nr:MAG: alpha/beta hydrolase [Clostridiales bacterium GWD2_32_19]